MRIWTLALLGILSLEVCGLSASETAKTAVGDVQVDRITSCLQPPVLVQGDARECKTLTARMAELKVPGVSVAMVHGGKIVWARAFGTQGPDGKQVTDSTLFQAGSISKPLAAMAALRLVQNGKLSLDTDINQVLTSWHLPPSPSAPNGGVTLRELLTHTGGIGVHGFPGYATGVLRSVHQVPTLFFPGVSIAFVRPRVRTWSGDHPPPLHLLNAGRREISVCHPFQVVVHDCKTQTSTSP